jgi:hypothetical protein
MSLRARINRLQQMMEEHVHQDEAPQPVPESWLERDKHGRLKGPGPGEEPTDVFEILAEMDRLTCPPPPLPRLRLEPPTAPTEETAPT